MLDGRMFTLDANGTSDTFVLNPWVKYHGLSVTGVGAAASAWTVNLQGSLDGVNFTNIVEHDNADGNGSIVASSTPMPVSIYRVHVGGLTLGSATGIEVRVAGA